MNIVDMIIVGTLLDELENKSTKKTEKSEPENPVEVCIYRDSMIVTFNDVDRHQIQEFILVLDANPCKYTQEEKEFEITANETTLYIILLYLTDEYEEIALY